MKQTKKLMNKEEIEIAVKQWNMIQTKYPEFSRMFNMLMEINTLSIVEDYINKKPRWYDKIFKRR